MPTFHGLHNAPVTRLWCAQIIFSSIVVSVLSVKSRFFLQWSPHIAIYGQWSRLVTHHLAFANSTELLVGVSLIYYTARPIERIWGSAKFVSFLATTAVITSLISLILLAALNSLDSTLNFIPPGPFALIAACLVQYYVALPSTYTFKWGASTKFTNKSIMYLAFAQLFLSQLPASSLACLSGALAGSLWRSQLFPLHHWRPSPFLRRLTRDWILPLVQEQASGSHRPPAHRSNYVTPQDVLSHVQGTNPSIIADWDINVRSSVQTGRSSRPGAVVNGQAATTRRRPAGISGTASSGSATPTQSLAPSQGPGEVTGRTARGGSRAAVARYLDSFTGAETANRLASAHENSVGSLSAMFPQMSREELSRALHDHDNDIERTVASLLEGNS